MPKLISQGEIEDRQALAKKVDQLVAAVESFLGKKRAITVVTQNLGINSQKLRQFRKNIGMPIRNDQLKILQNLAKHDAKSFVGGNLSLADVPLEQLIQAINARGFTVTLCMIDRMNLVDNTISRG